MLNSLQKINMISKIFILINEFMDFKIEKYKSKLSVLYQFNLISFLFFNILIKFIIFKAFLKFIFIFKTLFLFPLFQKIYLFLLFISLLHLKYLFFEQNLLIYQIFESLLKLTLNFIKHLHKLYKKKFAYFKDIILLNY